MKDYTATDAPILHTPAFDSAVIKVLAKAEDNLTNAEKELLLTFKLDQEVIEQDNIMLGIVERAAKKAKLAISESRYINLDFIPF